MKSSIQKLIVILFVVCSAVGAAKAQGTNARSEISGIGAPTGHCTVSGAGYSQTFVDRTTGDHYNCVGSAGTTNGDWILNGNHTFQTLPDDSSVFLDGTGTWSQVTFDLIGGALDAGNLTGTLPAISGANLTSLPAGNLTGTLPAISGANLTSLNASNFSSGTVPTARLGTGTANSGSFLRGDSTWQAVPTTSAGGSDTQFQYNSSGAFAGLSTFFVSNGTPTVQLSSLATTSTAGLVFSNGTSATNSVRQQVSPNMSFSALAWDTTGNFQTSSKFVIENLPLVTTSGSGNSSGQLLFRHFTPFSTTVATYMSLTTNAADGVSAGSLTTTNGVGLTINDGTLIKKHLSNTASLNFANQAAIGCNDLTITVTGAALGDTVALGVPNGSVVNGTAFFTAWVSSANTVSVRYCNLVSGDPASGTFRVDVWQH